MVRLPRLFYRKSSKFARLALLGFQNRVGLKFKNMPSGSGDPRRSGGFQNPVAL